MPSAPSKLPEPLEAKLSLHAEWLATRGSCGAQLELASQNLAGLDFSERNLERAVVRGCQLHGASFRGTNLRQADFSDAKGLADAQVSGADMFGAIIASSDAFSRLTKAASDSLASSRSIFLTTLVACVYVWLVLSQTADSSLIAGRTELALPIIDTKVNTIAFFFAAPPLLFCMYLYLITAIRRAWDQIENLPRVLPSGELAVASFSAGVLEGGLSRMRSSEGHQQFGRLERFISIALIWYLVPITLLLMWLRYLSMHDFVGTLLHAIFIGLAAAAGTMVWVARRGGAHSNPLTPTMSLAGRIGSTTVGAIVLLGAVSYYGFHHCEHSCLFGLFPNAKLGGATISTRAGEWRDLKDDDFLQRGGQLLTGRIPGAVGAALAGQNLRAARLEEAFLVNATLRKADLAYANLRGADLRGADLEGANLAWANLTDADLRGALLANANLEGAKLRNAKLSFARISGATLKRLDMGRLEIVGARVENSKFIEMRMLGALIKSSVLSSVQFENVDLDHLQIEGATLDRVTFRRSNLSEARIDATELNDVRFDGSSLRGVRVAGTKLRAVEFANSVMSQAHFEEADLSCPVDLDPREVRLWDRVRNDTETAKRLTCFKFEGSITYGMAFVKSHTDGREVDQIEAYIGLTPTQLELMGRAAEAKKP